MSDTAQKPLSVDKAAKPLTAKPGDDVRTWNDEQTRKAIAEADAGEFATPEEVKATVRKFVPNG